MKEKKKFTDLFHRKMFDRFMQDDPEDRLSEEDVRL